MSAVVDFPQGGEPRPEPPHNLEAEQALLGAVLFDNALFDRAAGWLQSEHFYHPAHAKLWDAVSELVNGGTLADPVTLKQRFADDPHLQEVGGPEYLTQLVDFRAGADVSHYARVIRDAWMRREALYISEDMAEQAVSGDATAQETVDRASDKLFSLQDTRGDTGPRDMAESMNETLQYLDDVHQGRIEPGLHTGLNDLDKITNGLGRGHLIILAGRPGMGKSALAVRIARYVAQQSDPTSGELRQALYFSLEMSAPELHQRLIAERTGIPYSSMKKKGSLSHDEQQRVQIAGIDLRGELALGIDDTSGLSVPQIQARCRAFRRQHGRLDLIIIDHLQLVRAVDQRMQGFERIGEMTRMLKTAAKSLNCPVVLLSQLNRGVESRDDKRPLLSDLRESGRIEEDADAVMLAYRAQYYLEKGEPEQREGENPEAFDKRAQQWAANLEASRNKAEIIVAKNRHGSEGIARLYCDMAINRFDDLFQERS